MGRDLEAATTLAQVLLDAAESEDGVDRVFVGEPRLIGGHWIFGYNSRRFVEDDDIMAALAGNGPIAVPVDESRPPFHLASSSSAESQLAPLAEGLEALMDGFEASATFLEYKGDKLRVHSFGGSYVRVEVAPPLTLDRFPEALEFSSDADDAWVMLPMSVFDTRHEQTVNGRWRGVAVAVDSVVKRGLNRGLARIQYEGTHPDEAVAAGLHGNQNDGWSALVPPSEIEDIVVTETVSPTMTS